MQSGLDTCSWIHSACADSRRVVSPSSQPGVDDQRGPMDDPAATVRDWDETLRRDEAGWIEERREFLI